MIIEKEGRELSIEEFEKSTGAKWAPYLEFADPKILLDLSKKGGKLRKKGELFLDQLWLGSYFKKEIESRLAPDVAIRWIDDRLGWGVFALRDFRRREFIAEYTGLVRKRISADSKNAYCFEHIIAQGVKSPYIIDAMNQGGISRYVNHSQTPNLHSNLATFDQISHVILYTKEPIAKGTQLCYDYGPDYWSKRTAPLLL